MKKKKQPSGWKAIPVAMSAPTCGLTAAQVQERRDGGWANTPVQSPTKSVKRIVAENVLTYFNLIFVLLAACLFAVGSFQNMLFLGIAVANTVIGIAQQIRSKRTVDQLNLLAAPHARVVRDGVLVQCATAELVRDDIVELAAGDQISADAVLCAGQMQVDESLLTGEADAVEKTAGDTLLSGSFVVAGRCRARLTKVGADSYAARLTLEAKRDVRVGRSEMMASLDRLIRIIGVLLLPIGAVLFGRQFFGLGESLHDAVVSTVAALIGMIPEGLYLLTSVALAVSVIRLARRKTLVQEMSCIETLARVDVLCVDKTGTITEPEMCAGEVILLDEEAFSGAQTEDALSAFCAAQAPDNDTARALCARFQLKTDWTVTKIIPFTAAVKWSAVVFAAHGAFLLGAPEFILGARYEALRARVEAYSRQGYRVLLAAAYDGTPDPKTLERARLRPMALVLLSNRIRATAPETFRYFAAQGVTIKVISGDNPLTVAEVARRAGVPQADRAVDAATLETDAAIEAAAEDYTVFGRVTPERKRKLIRALQKAGHTVAMTGDGVNDVLALKDADCGIAMASGSDAACHAAQLVLLNSDFSDLPPVVAEGRRVINNIQRASSLFLVKNIFSLCLSLITLFSVFPYPFVPIQFSLIGGLTIGIPSFFLALEANHSLVRGKFMHNVLTAALPGGLSNLLLILGLQLVAYRFGFPPAERSTLCTLLLAFNGLMILFEVCRPFDLQRKLVWGGMAGALLLAITVFAPVFSLVPLSRPAWITLVLFLLTTYPILRGMTALFSRLRRSRS